VKLRHAIRRSGIGQVIMATYAPALMAYPGARLLRLSQDGLSGIKVAETEHFRTMREFWADPTAFTKQALADVDDEAM
jgi:predicted ATPase